MFWGKNCQISFPSPNRDRIMVTLSCLIVEAGLYSQINSNMPASASPKAVDIFFFYNIARLFWVCLHHTINYRWLSYLKQKKTENDTKKSLNAIKDNTIPKEINKSSLSKLITLKPAPDEIKIINNSWLTEQVKQKEGNSTTDMKTFTSLNKVVVLLYMITDCSFVAIFVLYIMYRRNIIFEQFESSLKI